MHVAKVKVMSVIDGKINYRWITNHKYVRV